MGLRVVLRHDSGAILALMLANITLAQTAKEQPLMLAEDVHLTGTVRDFNGKPLADVWINHSGQHPDPKTDQEGRFDITTRAPAVVFRKEGFNGHYIRVEKDATIEITLESVKALRACKAHESCVALRGFMSAFCLPRVRGVQVMAQNYDVDYGQQAFLIRTPSGKTGIQHAAGPTWGGGLFDRDVWSSVQYTETDYRDADGFAVMDARGQTARGDCWRVVGSFGESASYRDVSISEAGLLDRVLDGICVKHRIMR